MIDVSVDPLTEVAWSSLVARNTRVLLVQHIGALPDQVVDIRIIVGKAKRSIDAGDVDVVELNTWARVHIRTVDRRGNVEARSTVDVLSLDVLNLQLGGVAALVGVVGVDALRELDGKTDVDQLEVLEGHVLDETAAATTVVAVAGHVGAGSLPGLDVGAVHGVLDGHVLEGDVLVVVWGFFVLTDRSNGDSSTTLAVNVLGEQVGGIALGSNTIVTGDNGSVLDEQVVALPGIVTIAVHSVPLAVTGGIDEQVGEGNVVAVPDESGPELWSNNTQVVDKDIAGVVNSETHGASRLVGLISVCVIPLLAIAVVEATLAVERHIGTSKEPGSDLVLQDNANGMGSPVGNVGGEA